MSSPRYNKLACLKEIGAIEHRVSDASLPPSVRRACIRRNVENLIAELTTTPANAAKFGGILERLHGQHTDELEIIAGCSLLRSLIPLTYGCIPAGTAFYRHGRVIIKRKGGVQFLDSAFIHTHLAADTPVIVINA